jgi:hypothetical protein
VEHHILVGNMPSSVRFGQRKKWRLVGRSETSFAQDVRITIGDALPDDGVSGRAASSQLRRMPRPAPALLTAAFRVLHRGKRPGFGGIIGGCSAKETIGRHLGED